MVRDRLTGWVSRAAPIVAAQAVIVDGRVDEGSLWRTMTAEMRKFQLELSQLELHTTLAMAGEEDGGE